MDDQHECLSRRRSQPHLTEATAPLANRVVLGALSAIARKRQDERDGTRWDPSQPLLAGRNGAIPEGHIPQHHHTHETHDHAPEDQG